MPKKKKKKKKEGEGDQRGVGKEFIKEDSAEVEIKYLGP
jgi:hypothetical protein